MIQTNKINTSTEYLTVLILIILQDFQPLNSLNIIKSYHVNLKYIHDFLLSYLTKSLTCLGLPEILLK